MQFFVWLGVVYAHDENKAYALDTRGYDDPEHWVWQSLPEKVFETIETQYKAHDYRGPG